MAENENALGAAEATPEAQTGGSAEAMATMETADAPPATTDEEEQAAPASTEEITYHAVEKDGQVAALWEMQGRKHLRTIDPRSRQGRKSCASTPPSTTTSTTSSNSQQVTSDKLKQLAFPTCHSSLITD